MPHKVEKARVTVVATFPPGFFLENIAGSNHTGFYISCMNRQELYWVPEPDKHKECLVFPHLLETFPGLQRPMGIVQAPQNNNLQYIVTSDLVLSKGERKSYLRILDTTASAIHLRTEVIGEFPAKTQSLNGFCSLSDKVLIVADSFASCVWRIDLEETDGSCSGPLSSNVTAKFRVWFSHHSMDGKLNPNDIQPGINGLKYSARTGYAYYTSTQQRLFCRIRVNPNTFDAVGEPEVLAKGWQWDDLILDDREGVDPVAYVTTHRDDSIVRVRLNPESLELSKDELEVVVQGGPGSMDCVGPTAGVWLDGCMGRSALFTCDGGIKNLPADGVARCAKILQVDFD